MSDTENTVRGKATRDFNDAGTERNFEKGGEYDFTPGELRNYRLAGLVDPVEAAAPAAPAAEPVEGSKTKTTRG